MPSTQRVTLLAAALVAAAALPATAHTAGSCSVASSERCERWSAVLTTPTTGDRTRSDQFAGAVHTTPTSVVAVAKDVAFDTVDPYATAGRALVVGYDKATGAERWRVPQTARHYANVGGSALSPDGKVLVVTSGDYDGYVLDSTDAQLLTFAVDTATGAVLWSTRWQGRPDATDNGKQVVVSPDGTEAYVTGVTTAAGGDLDYVTVGYSVADGRQLWSAVYAGPRDKGTDAPFGLAVSPSADAVVVTGWSDGVTDYDADYGTVAYALGHTTQPGDKPGKGKGKGHAQPVPGPAAGTVLWTSRFDGLGLHKSDRANAIAVSPDGALTYVTGDSYAGKGGGDYDATTVAYDSTTGAQRWVARFSGGRGGFNSGTRLTPTSGGVLLSSQSTAPSTDDGNDAVTVAYDTAGRQVWTGSVAPARSDDYVRDVEVAGSTAYVVSSSTPLVKYTALSRLVLTAYDVSTGLVRWQTNLDGGTLNALSAASVAAAGDTVAVLGELKRSADPTGPQNQDVYDLVVAAFAT